MIKNHIKNILNRFPYIRSLYKFKKQYENASCFLPGHFYSPLVDKDEIKNYEEDLWETDYTPEGIDINVKGQLKMVADLSGLYDRIKFLGERQKKYRYYVPNGAFDHTDAIILAGMLLHFKPSKIIEVGSGFSSAVMLDTIEHNQCDTKLTFIEPYPEALKNLLRKGDSVQHIFIFTKVQNVPITVFKELEKDDILFIDSSHVSKTGSDVNYIFFKILPVLKQGVIIHFHDIFYPFEYPHGWILEGRNWNEDYLLRAFLMYNPSFEIICFNHFLHQKHSEIFQSMPLCYNNPGGSIWIRKNNHRA